MNDNSTIYNNKKNFQLWLNHKNLLSKISKYQIFGNVILSFEKKKNIIKFYLKQCNNNSYNLVIMNVFGFIEMNIIIDSNFIKFTNKFGDKFINENIDKIIFNYFGINLSLNDIKNWIIGLPGDNDFTLDNYGRLKMVRYKIFNQIWIINYNNYNIKLVPILPIDLECSCNNIFIKIKINDWKLS